VEEAARNALMRGFPKRMFECKLTGIMENYGGKVETDEKLTVTRLAAMKREMLAKKKKVQAAQDPRVA